MNTVNKRLNIKLTPEHKEALIKLAEVESECMSVVIRNLIKQAALDRGIWKLTKMIQGNQLEVMTIEKRTL